MSIHLDLEQRVPPPPPMASKSPLITSSSFFLTSVVLFIVLLFIKPIASSSSSNTLENSTHLSRIQSLCQSTPYPASCLDSLKLSISINISPSILTYAFQTIQSAISDAVKLTGVLQSPSGIVEKQRGSIQDCQELHQITLSSLKKSSSILQSSSDSRNLADVRAYLSAALTNKATCLDGLAGASGPSKPALVASVLDAYSHVSNSLSIVSRSTGGRKGRRLSRDFPAWVRPRDRRLLLQSSEYDPASALTVAADGSGNFTSIGEAVAFAPNDSADRTIIVVRAGVYDENVDIPAYKTNIVLLGEGSDVTLIRGGRSVGDGWTTFRSATVAVSGQGFLARDIAIQNIAGASKAQAVALRVNADTVAVYRCQIDGYQDTLYVHSFRQFYRECDIYGTIDFVFGNAAVIFQGCNLIARKPLPGQSSAITAQSRDDPNEDTGISIQNCSVLASDDLSSSSGGVRTYLGRPWRLYSRTVYIESYMDDLVDPSGWTEWPGSQGLDTLYYGEYSNSGPGSATDDRVAWPGYHVMDYDDATSFTVSEFIDGDQWLDSTSFPYDDEV